MSFYTREIGAKAGNDRAVDPKGNAWMDFFEGEDGKWTCESVSLWAARGWTRSRRRSGRVFCFAPSRTTPSSCAARTARTGFTASIRLARLLKLADANENDSEARHKDKADDFEDYLGTLGRLRAGAARRVRVNETGRVRVMPKGRV